MLPKGSGGNSSGIVAAVEAEAFSIQCEMVTIFYRTLKQRQ
jgi:hypothetical protein